MHAYKNLKIMLWNPQSINSTSKQQMLNLALHTEHIDILILVETFLKPIHNFQINNYIIYRNDRSTHAHGGVAIAIRKNIAHKYIAPVNTHTIENVAIEMSINNTPTSIIAAYSPKYTHNFSNDLLALTTTTKNQYILFGDLNAKHTSWNCCVNNTAGCKLYALQQNSNFMIFHPTEHTHHPHSGQSPSTIDLLLSNVNFAFDLSVHSDQMTSDHVPVICSTNERIDLPNNFFFDYAKADWNT